MDKDIPLPDQDRLCAELRNAYYNGL